MEIWLSYNNMEEKLRLPVLPEEFSVSAGSEIKTININAVGEIALIGKTKLKKISFQSFFPSVDYPFCQYSGFPSPYDCVALIEKWQQSQRPIRLIITETPINFAMAIEVFDYGEKPGSRDVEYTLSLKEYRFLKIPTTATPVATVSSNTLINLASRTTEKQPEKTYTVKRGDTLSAIAKMAYGDAGKYKIIAQANNIADPNKIYPGQVFIL